MTKEQAIKKLEILLESTYDAGDINVEWVRPYREGIQDCIKVLKGQRIT